MELLFWDASALSKRYFSEMGSATVNAVFAHHGAHEMASTPLGYAETFSILLRRLNGGILDSATFATQTSALQSEVVQDNEFALLTVTDAVIFSSIATMRRHNLNATDAILLTLLIEFSQSPDAPECVMVASDQRLLRAAAAEGFQTINPETLTPANAVTFLTSLG